YLGGPGVDEVPASHFCAISQVKNNNRAVFAHNISLYNLLTPIPQFGCAGHAPLENNVGIGGLARELMDSSVVTSLACLDNLGCCSQSRAFDKADLGDAVQFHKEVKDAEWIDSLSCLCHK